MHQSLLVTKFFVPPSADTVARPLLVQRLNEGLSRKLTLVCAGAGFGKSTLISQWAHDCVHPSAWLSLDEEERDPTRFLEYLVSSLQSVSDAVGAGLVAALRGSPPASASTVLTILVNQLSTISGKLVLILDDYHLAASAPVNEALAFLIDQMPAQFHVVIASRELPDIALGRLRAQGQLAEIRQEDLRFAQVEAQIFFQQHLRMELSKTQVHALEERTEGWVAGLKLAALSLQGHRNTEAFIASFTGSNRFVHDYLIEEVLHQQTAEVQAFLLRSAVLDRLCASLCNAVVQGQDAHRILLHLEQSNLFIVPLDSERRWYRYHHLFSALLRERLRQHEPLEPLHLRASQWYESQGLEVEAFLQAAAALDIPRAIRLIGGNGMPIYFRGEVAPVSQWLSALPPAVLNAHPALWLMFAWTMLISGQPMHLEAKLKSAEAALRNDGPHAGAQELEGHLSVLHAWLAVSQNKPDAIHAHATRALELLSPDSLPERTAAQCALGVALLFSGNRSQAGQAFAKVIDASRNSGNRMFAVVASIALASIHASEYRLHSAAAMYRDAIQMIADPTQSVGYEAHLGLAKILYEWNAIDEALVQTQLASQLSICAASESGLGAAVLRVRAMLALDATFDVDTALTQAGEAARSKKPTVRIDEVVEMRALHVLRQGDIDKAAQVASQSTNALLQARVLSAQGKTPEALQRVETYRRNMEDAGLVHEAVKAMVVQVLVLQSVGEVDQALQVLQALMARAEPQAAVRLLVDEGAPVRDLLARIAPSSAAGLYAARLMALFGDGDGGARAMHITPAGYVNVPQAPTETFSERELEVLRLIQEGHSNQSISERLFVSLSTVKWHNQNIFSKLGVQRRTEAVARALELRLLSAG